MKFKKLNIFIALLLSVGLFVDLSIGIKPNNVEVVNTVAALNKNIEIMVTGDSYEHTWLNYEYDICRYSTGDFWRVTKPDGGSLTKTRYKETYRTTTNKYDLDDYRSKVIEINGWETGAGLLLMAGGSLLIAASVATAGVASAAFWAALGFFGGDVAALVTVDNLCKQADVIYGKYNL